MPQMSKTQFVKKGSGRVLVALARKCLGGEGASRMVGCQAILAFLTVTVLAASLERANAVQ